MTQSTDKVDKRLISLYMLRKAHDQKHVFGFDNELLLNERRKLSSFTPKVHNARDAGLKTELRNFTAMEEQKSCVTPSCNRSFDDKKLQIP